MAKLKMTGFARLLIAIIFIVPIAYLGATFINGGQELDSLKEMLGIETSTPPTIKEDAPMVPAERTPPPPPPMEKVGQNEEVMDELREKLNEMYDENSALKEEIVKLRKQLEATQE